MSIKLFSASFNGIDGNIVTVEVDISKGLPAFNIVGLGDMSIKESKERVRSAIENSSFEFPLGRITVNLAPADLRKEGSLFDLPIAVGILFASEQINICDVEKFLFVGELSLSGELNKIRGALPIVIEGSNKNFKNFIIPIHNINECSLIIKDKNIYPFKNLNQVIHFFQYRDLMPYKNEVIKKEKEYNIDFRDVCGQNSSKRALEIAAAGNHNIIMFGPPGSGKSMLAQRIPTILPNLDYDEALEVTKIYSVSGNLRGKNGVELFRPFRNPHHTVTPAGLIGGGNRVSPGEVSLAHNGVLFLDEILEFKKNVLELLRQPLEDKFIEITRAYGKVKYPSNFMLVAAMNPCPCGYFASGQRKCLCSEYERKRYLNKLSGPLIDRIDMFTFVGPSKYSDIKEQNMGEPSSAIKKRVSIARDIQKSRFKYESINTNSQMNVKLIKRYCKLDEKCESIMKKIFTNYKISTRAYYRILKVSRTIADLKNKENIVQEDIIEAINYRKFINGNII